MESKDALWQEEQRGGTEKEPQDTVFSDRVSDNIASRCGQSDSATGFVDTRKEAGSDQPASL